MRSLREILGAPARPDVAHGVARGQGALDELGRVHGDVGPARIVVEPETGAAALVVDAAASAVGPSSPAHLAPRCVRMPARFHGRDLELETLREALLSVRADRGIRIVCLSGDPGIGKSSLVRELARSTAHLPLDWAAGQADSARRDEPYLLFRQVMRALVHTLLAAPEHDLAELRDGLRHALGDNAGALSELAPDLALLLGEQPPPPPLPSFEHRGRLLALVSRFFGCVASPARPLALFLDDLQWADGASLDLLAHLAIGAASSPLLLVLAYRPREVGAGHRVEGLLAELAARAPVTHLRLDPLTEPAVATLLADCLGADAEPWRAPSAECPPVSEDIARLASALHAKTMGNPFEVLQLLDALVSRDAVTLDRQTSSWRWDPEGVAAAGLSESVADLLAARIAGLPEETRTLIELAACIGNTLDVGLLARLTVRTPQALHDELLRLVQAGFLVPASASFAFAHERIRDAALLLSPAVRAERHLAIGRDLLATAGTDALGPRLFEACDHLILGAPSVTSPGERAAAARVCLRAATSAHATGAFRSSLNYASAARAIRCGTQADIDPELDFDIDFLFARSLWPLGDYAAAERQLEELVARATRRLDRVFLYRELVAMCGASMDLARGFRAVVECLGLFGRTMMFQPPADLVLERHAAVQRRLGSRAVESLVDLPLATDPEGCALLDLLRAFGLLAWGLGRSLRDLVACEMMDLTLTHGLSAAAPEAAAYYAAFLTGSLERPAEGARFAAMARALVTRTGLRSALPRVHNICALIEVWTRPFAELRSLSESGYRAALEVGDSVFVVFNLQQVSVHRFMESHALTQVLASVDKALTAAREAHFPFGVGTLKCFLQLVAALRGETSGVASLSGGDFDEDAVAAELDALPIPHTAHYYRSVAVIARFLGGDIAGAWRLAQHNAELERSGLWVLPALPIAQLIGTLAGAALADRLAGEARAQVLDAVAREELRWERLAARTPESFLAMSLVLQAEGCRLRSDRGAALSLYDAAIRAARQSGLLHFEAIACELAARALRATGVDIAARAYLCEAHRAYGQWGALGKVRLLEELHPELAELAALTRSPRMPATTLDMLTLAKASQAIGSELALERLLPLLIRITVESSGARKGHLVLAGGGGPNLVASADETGRVDVRARPLSEPGALAASVVRYALRTGLPVVLDGATIDQRFASDPYLRSHRSGSVLCVPISRGPRPVGVLYLENDLIDSAFTPGRVTLVEHLAAQAAISLDNARLFSEVREAEAERAALTADLRRRAI